MNTFDGTEHESVTGGTVDAGTRWASKIVYLSLRLDGRTLTCDYGDGTVVLVISFGTV